MLEVLAIVRRIEKDRIATVSTPFAVVQATGGPPAQGGSALLFSGPQRFYGGGEPVNFEVAQTPGRHIQFVAVSSAKPADAPLPPTEDKRTPSRSRPPRRPKK